MAPGTRFLVEDTPFAKVAAREGCDGVDRTNVPVKCMTQIGPEELVAQAKGISRSPHMDNQYESRIFTTKFLFITF